MEEVHTDYVTKTQKVLDGSTWLSRPPRIADAPGEERPYMSYSNKLFLTKISNKEKQLIQMIVK